MPVFTEMYYTDASQPNLLAPDGFDGWVMRSRDGLPLQALFIMGEVLTMQAKSTWLNGFIANINPYAMQVNYAEFSMGRWSSVRCLADWIYKNGLPDYKYYKHKNENVFWMLKNRKNLFEFSRLFQAGNIKFISFCDNQHETYLKHFFEDKWSVEQFLKYARQHFAIVKFSELSNFIFPQGEAEGRRVFIEDDFRDLLQDDYEWVRPHYQVDFTLAAGSKIDDCDKTMLIAELKMAALQFPMQLTVTASGGTIQGTIKWLRKFFPQYFAEHFISNFFAEKNVDANVTNV